MRTDKDFIKAFREDVEDLLHQLDEAQNVEDLEQLLLDSIQQKIWVVNMEIDRSGREL